MPTPINPEMGSSFQNIPTNNSELTEVERVTQQLSESRLSTPSPIQEYSPIANRDQSSVTMTRGEPRGRRNRSQPDPNRFVTMTRGSRRKKRSSSNRPDDRHVTKTRGSRRGKRPQSVPPIFSPLKGTSEHQWIYSPVSFSPGKISVFSFRSPDDTKKNAEKKQAPKFLVYQDPE